MSALSISIPDSIKNRVESLASEDGVTVEEYIATVLSQRIAVAEVDSYMRRRAAKGSAETLIRILDRAPDVDPEACDRITAMENN